LIDVVTAGIAIVTAREALDRLAGRDVVDKD
jgi:hypothetical protein